MVGEFVEQGFKYGAGLLAVFAKNIALLDVVGPLATGEWFLIEGDVGNQVKNIQFTAVGNRLLQDFQRYAMLGQFFQYGLLAFGAVPAAQEVSHGAEFGLQRFPDVVLE